MVQGACVAGGCGLATAHDFVVATATSRFLYSEVRIGFVAALVATFLPLRMRGSDIREMLLNPEFVTAQQALETGLVNRVVGEGELRQSGEHLAIGILERASSESVARTKRLLLEVLGLPLNEALQRAAVANAEARATEDCKHGIATFLATKAPPSWRESGE
jgi:methylglutaconyl-CoA hydratase